MSNPILVEALGDAVNLRILNFFVENPFDAYTVAEVARFARVARNSVYKYHEIYVRKDYLRTTEKNGRTYYRLNRSHPVIQLIDKFVRESGDSIVGVKPEPIYTPSEPVIYNANEQCNMMQETSSA